MFNGIIKYTGKLNKILKKQNDYIIHINSKIKFSKNDIGSSIACSGACLTLNSFKKNTSSYYLSRETINKTNFKFLKKGNVINLEKSMKYGERLSGHFVQGHVDTVSKIKKIDFVGKSWIIYFSLPKSYK